MRSAPLISAAMGCSSLRPARQASAAPTRPPPSARAPASSSPRRTWSHPPPRAGPAGSSAAVREDLLDGDTAAGQMFRCLDAGNALNQLPYRLGRFELKGTGVRCRTPPAIQSAALGVCHCDGADGRVVSEGLQMPRDCGCVAGAPDRARRRIPPRGQRWPQHARVAQSPHDRVLYFSYSAEQSRAYVMLPGEHARNEGDGQQHDHGRPRPRISTSG